MPQTVKTSAANTVAEVYARSLLELADEAGGDTPEEVGAELAQIVELMGEQPDLRRILQDPAVPARRRAESIERLFKGRVTDLTYRFLRVLNDKGRLDQLTAIQQGLASKLKARRGEFDVDVYAAQPLSDEQARRVAERVGSLMGGTALVTQRVDPSMIGGLKLRIGDRLIDASIATRLQHMRRRLQEKTREAVRHQPDRMLAEEGAVE